MSSARRHLWEASHSDGSMGSTNMVNLLSAVAFCRLAGGNHIACVSSHKTLIFVIVTFCIMLDWVRSVIVTYYCLVIQTFITCYFSLWHCFFKEWYFRKLKFLIIFMHCAEMLCWSMFQPVEDLNPDNVSTSKISSWV